MSNLLDFFIRHKNTLLFLLLLTFSLGFTFQTHSYQKSKFVSSTNAFSGKFYKWDTGVKAYFSLKGENKRLIEENKRLRQNLYNVGFARDSAERIKDTIFYGTPYKIYNAKVIANRYRGLDNYILLDKGASDSIQPELGVATPKGILGVVEDVSQNYARVISVLNSNLAINAQLKKSEHFGTLNWDGQDPNVLNLIDIPRTAKVNKGDTIMTNGRSLIFPKGILIGVVDKAEIRSGQNYYDIQVKLFNDMTAIENVYVIKNESRLEADSLRYRNEK